MIRFNVIGMVHDVVEVNAQPEAMRDSDHFHKFILGAVPRSYRPALVLVAQVERIEQIVPDRKPAHRLGRRRQPQARITRLRNFGNLLGDLSP
jgi:hypothetical protein